jgi:Protein of unknown function (DUF4065)
MTNSLERISTPTLQVEKFKNVLLYILERCAGKPNVGEKVLGKLLYFSDFNNYEIYEEQLTGATYRKLPNGPIPDELESILSHMVEERQLHRVITVYPRSPLTRYLPLVKPDLTKLLASEVGVIDRVIGQMGDWSETMITAYSHGDRPWEVTKDSEELNYELAFYRDVPYTVRVYEEDE